MKKFENYREFDVPREKHPSIELSDRECMENIERLRPKLVYRSPSEIEDIKVIDLNEKSKSQITKRKTKKNNSKSNASTMASI
jgi:hypothetical protein